MSPHESLCTTTIVDRYANHLLPLPKRSALRLTMPSFRRLYHLRLRCPISNA